MCCLRVSASCAVLLSLCCVSRRTVSRASSLVWPALLCARPVRRVCSRVTRCALCCVYICSWSVYLPGLYLVIASSSRPDLYKYISLSVSRRCIFVSSSVWLICMSDLLAYLEFRVSSGYSVSRMSCLLRCPCLPRISCPLVSFLSTSNLCAPVKNTIISRKSRDAQTHKHMVV